MKRELVAFMCITMSLASFAGHKENWNFKEQKDIKVIERSWGEDKRSIPYVPHLSHNGNIIYIYSDIILEDLQITILNEFDSIVYSSTITVFNNQDYPFQFSTMETGTYTIELTNGEHSFWGQFTLY